MAMTYQEIAEKLAKVAEADFDFGECYGLFGSFATIYEGGSGYVCLELHRVDYKNPIEKLAHAVGIENVQKKFFFNTEEELRELLDILITGQQPKTEE
jgi:hypothetical protein